MYNVHCMIVHTHGYIIINEKVAIDTFKTCETPKICQQIHCNDGWLGKS